MAKLDGEDEYGNLVAKKPVGSVFPEHVVEAAPGLARIEPFLTPTKFKERFLFGIPLISPTTKETITEDMLKDYVTRGASQFELEAQVEIFRVVRQYRLPFEPDLYMEHIFLTVPHKPVQHLLELSIRSAAYNDPSNTTSQGKYPKGNLIYKIPNEWVEMGNAIRGIINVNPLNPAFSAIGTSQATAANGATLMQFIGQQRSVPAYWHTEVVQGFSDDCGRVPTVINEAVGNKAVMIILNNLIPQYRLASQSLSIDGMSQSVNDQLYALLQDKRQQAEKDYEKAVKRIKMMTGNKIIMGHV